MKIFHNSRCSKSRSALSILQEKQLDVTVVNYLETPPSIKEIKEILQKLGMKAEDLIRKGEKEFKENFQGKKLTEEEWVNAMAKYPKLIERPIFVNGDKAVVGRPPEKVLELIE